MSFRAFPSLCCPLLLSHFVLPPFPAAEVHMIFGSYHKDSVPKPWYGVYRSMEEAKKEVERAKLDCFQIKTVVLDGPVFA